MNKDILSGYWKQIRGEVKKTWGDLTDDELDQIDGQRDKLAGRLQERYGWDRLRAEQEIDRFVQEVQVSLKDDYR